MTGSAARQTRSTPNKLVSICARASAMGVSSTGPIKAQPATWCWIAARATAISRARRWRPGRKRWFRIEISPSSVECIRRNLAAETAGGRVIVYPKGVWDKDDTLTLNLDDTNFAANSVVMCPESAHPSVLVPLTTIDKLVAALKLPRVDFIKMDIEGGDCHRAQAG